MNPSIPMEAFEQGFQAFQNVNDLTELKGQLADCICKSTASGPQGQLFKLYFIIDQILIRHEIDNAESS